MSVSQVWMSKRITNAARSCSSRSKIVSNYLIIPNGHRAEFGLIRLIVAPISDDIAKLQSHVSAFGGRLDVIDSRITALKETVRPTSAT